MIGEGNHRISEVTRRNIADAVSLQGINWAGRFEEHEFLSRLYDLQSMPSTDYRYSNASQDIWKHRTMNSDWQDDWVFYDSRFALIRAPDEEFLRFLCETLHPVVQPDPTEVVRTLDVFNTILAADGWQLVEQMSVSGRPVYAAVPSLEAGFHAQSTARVVVEAIGSDYVSRQVTRMQGAIRGDPDLAIGQAKEFVETICKSVLSERAIAYDAGIDFPKLVRLTMTSMELVNCSVSDARKTADAVKRLLSGLLTVTDSMAQLRNLQGTGHGKEAESTVLPPRHARLMVGAATALAVFLLECHKEDDTRRG